MTAVFLIGAFFGAVVTILALALWADWIARAELRALEREGKFE